MNAESMPNKANSKINLLFMNEIIINLYKNLFIFYSIYLKDDKYDWC